MNDNTLVRRVYSGYRGVYRGEGGDHPGSCPVAPGSRTPRLPAAHGGAGARSTRVWSIYTTSNGKVGCNEDHPTGPKR
jgi:hypothetical protein